MNFIKRVIIVVIIIISIPTIQGQHFIQPLTNYELIQYDVNVLSSKGYDSTISILTLDREHLEFGAIFNIVIGNVNQYTFKGQLQYLFNISDRIQYLIGFNGGVHLINNTSGFIIGGTTTVRWWLSKSQRLALNTNFSIDSREFKSEEYPLKLGLTYRLSK